MHQHTHINRSDSSTRIGWAFFLNVGFTIIEFIGGWLTNSTDIMDDADHDLADILSIGHAWLLNAISANRLMTHRSMGKKGFHSRVLGMKIIDRRASAPVSHGNPPPLIIEVKRQRQLTSQLRERSN